MKLVVLGASGGCGKQLVEQALARGHEVTAVVRPSTSYTPPAGVKLARGEVTDRAFLAATFRGHDAVLSGLGMRLSGLSPFASAEVPDLLSRSSPIIVQAMQEAGVGRLLAISAGGVGDSYVKMPAIFKMFIRTTALRKVYPELDAMEKTFFASGLDVSCPRPTGLTDKPATGEARVVEQVTGRATIPRADVAAWMLDEVVKPTLQHRAPVLTVTGAG
jgi:putative NADH-flavin reductase